MESGLWGLGLAGVELSLPDKEGRVSRPLAQPALRFQQLKQRRYSRDPLRVPLRDPKTRTLKACFLLLISGLHSVSKFRILGVLGVRGKTPKAIKSLTVSCLAMRAQACRLRAGRRTTQ